MMHLTVVNPLQIAPKISLSSTWSAYKLALTTFLSPYLADRVARSSNALPRVIRPRSQAAFSQARSSVLEAADMKQSPFIYQRNTPAMILQVSFILLSSIQASVSEVQPARLF
jgi:hypothetical protein